MKLRSSLVLKTALIMGSATIAPTIYASTTLYQETFPWTNTQTQDAELRNQGWCGGNAGDDISGTPCNPAGTTANNGGEGAISSSTSGGSTVTPSENINNNPQGPIVTDSFAFWSQTAIFAQSFLFTNEFRLRSSWLESVTWDERDSGSDLTRLAFRIDDDWYISDQTWSNSSATWVLITADLKTLTFFIVEGNNDLSKLPGVGTAPPCCGSPLPNGEINAFGFSWVGQKTANSRVDNVKLVGQIKRPSPQTASVPALSGFGLGLLTLLLPVVVVFRTRWRRQAR